MSKVPSWFTAAIEGPRNEGIVGVNGTDIHYLEWGDRTKPGTVLVHGGSAHAHWWAHLAPMLAERYHPVALDLSGHGDSGRREEYSFELWAEELMAVCVACGIDDPPVLVGHSMGGLVSIVAAALHGERLRGVIIVDSPVIVPDPEQEVTRVGRTVRELKVYPDLETALGRFRLIPPQPTSNKFIHEYIARNSLRQVDGGWTWKFDPNIRIKRAAINEFLAGIQTRVALFRGELSELVTADVSDYMHELLGRNAPVVAIPNAYHHLIIDEPLAFIAALRAIPADWEHSVPKKPAG